MIIIGIGNQKVLPAVVIKIGNDRLAGFCPCTVATGDLDTGRLGDVAETALPVVDQQSVSNTTHQQEIRIGIIVDVLRCHTSSGKRGWTDCLAAPEFAEPGGRTVHEFNAGCTGDVRKKVFVGMVPTDRYSGSNWGGFSIPGGQIVMTCGANANLSLTLFQIVNFQCGRTGSLFGNLSRQTQHQHAVLGCPLGDNFRGKRIKCHRKGRVIIQRGLERHPVNPRIT